MKAVIQRVKKAKVTTENTIVGQIGKGILVLAAFHKNDTLDTFKWMSHKIANLRIFSDENDKLNLSVQDVGGEILIVSNFTVYGDTKKGARPSYSHSADPETAEKLYDDFIKYIKSNYRINIQTGKFRAMMDIELINDGPVTLIVEK